MQVDSALHSPDPVRAAREFRVRAMLTLAITWLAYSASLAGGFLNYDDAWLIIDNAVLSEPSWNSLWKIAFAFDLRTRVQLGAEYLPVRDLTILIEGLLHGLNPHALRVSNLLIYSVAVVAFHRYFLCVFRSLWPATVAALLFALHPAHVESVAWLASRKDVLALAFVGLGLWLYAENAGKLWRIPVLVVAALLSKSASVVLIPLLPVTDLLLGRHAQWRTVGVAAVTAVICMVPHLVVGSIVGMRQDVPGGSPLCAFAQLGVLLLRYARLAIDPSALSVIHEQTWPPAPSLVNCTGWLLFLAWFALGLWLRVKRGHALVFGAWLWFVVPLAPVSHVLYALPNRIADRYLWLSIAALALLLGAFARRRSLARRILAGSVVVAFTVSAAWRAWSFAESNRLFAAALRVHPSSRSIAYQLAKAREAAGDTRGAIDAYIQVLGAQHGSPKVVVRAVNSLATLYGKMGCSHKSQGVLLWSVRAGVADSSVVRRLRRGSPPLSANSHSRRESECPGEFPARP